MMSYANYYYKCIYETNVIKIIYYILNFIDRNLFSVVSDDDVRKELTP